MIIDQLRPIYEQQAAVIGPEAERGGRRTALHRDVPCQSTYVAVFRVWDILLAKGLPGQPRDCRPGCEEDSQLPDTAGFLCARATGHSRNWGARSGLGQGSGTCEAQGEVGLRAARQCHQASAGHRWVADVGRGGRERGHPRRRYGQSCGVIPVYLHQKTRTGLHLRCGGSAVTCTMQQPYAAAGSMPAQLSHLRRIGDCNGEHIDVHPGHSRLPKCVPEPFASLRRVLASHLHKQAGQERAAALLQAPHAALLQPPAHGAALQGTSHVVPAYFLQPVRCTSCRPCQSMLISEVLMCL